MAVVLEPLQRQPLGRTPGTVITVQLLRLRIPDDGEQVAADTAVLEAAMPPMITAAALAISHRLAPSLASALVGYGILFSLATLPAWAWLLTSYL